MSRTTRHLLKSTFAVIVLVVTFTASASQMAVAQKRVALVIGNNAYRAVPELVTAASDARTIGQALRGIGFSVDIVENGTRGDTATRVQAFESAIEPGDIVFFFFAGHGVEIRGRNYLLPVDVPAPTDDSPIINASMPPDVLLERLSARRPGAIVFVLDACRDNPFEREGTRTIVGARGLASAAPTEQAFVLYSAGMNQRALDRLNDNDQDPNSVFTRAFARELVRPGATMVEIAKRTQVAVRQTAAAVRHPQSPAYYDQIVGDLVLSVSAPDSAAR
jgi:hypothetical protein